MENAQPSNSPDCINQTMLPEHRRLILLVQGATGGFSLAVCVVAMSLFCLCRVYRRFTHRISFYLLLSASLTEVMSCLQVAMFEYDSSNMTFVYVCKVLGFLHQYSICSMLLFMSVLVFHLACVAILIEIRPTILMGVTYRVLISTLSEPAETTRSIARRHALCLEACYVLIPVLCPLLFAWVPFIHDAYGLAGASCWIREVDDDCNHIDAGVVEMYAFWYAPDLLVCFMDSILIVAILIILCKRACATQQTPDPAYKNALKENIPLFVFPIFFQCFALVSIGQRIHKTVTSELPVHHVLWLTHALIPPLRGLLVAIVYIIYLIVWKLSNRSPNITRENTPLLRSK